MTLKILEEKENSLLERKEVKFILQSVKNPSFPEASKFTSEQFKSAEELIAVRGIKGKFGMDTFLISANIYSSKEAKNKHEKKKEEKVAGK